MDPITLTLLLFLAPGSPLADDFALSICSTPSEPARFVSCDGPHSGTPDDKRPPHWLDIIHEGLVSTHIGWRYLVAAATCIADAWAGYGFTAADLAAWAAAGITEPAVAAECRAEGFNPREEVDRRFLRSLADPTDLESSTWAEVLDLGDDTAQTAWAAFQGAP